MRTSRRVDAPSDRRPRVGQRITIPITEMTASGEAIGKFGQYVIFVRGAIPGERVQVEVTQVKNRYGRGTLLDVVEPSRARVEPLCRHFGICGRCAWQHIAYPEQLRMKGRLLRGLLERALPGMPLPIRPVIGMADPWGTRNKVHFVLGSESGRPILGHYESHSRNLVPIVECPVHHPIGNEVAQSILPIIERHNLPIYDDKHKTGLLRHLVVRVSAGTEEPKAHAVLVAASRKLSDRKRIADEILASQPALSGVHLNVNDSTTPMVLSTQTERLAGEGRLIERIGDIDYLVSPTAFFQTNPEAAASLVETVLGGIPDNPGGPILDLYAGVGLFAIALAHRGHRVVAVEENPLAVQDGIATLEHNGIAGCRFHTGKVESVLRKIARHEKYPVVILDPPREGCPAWVARWLARGIRPERIIDVSCEPTALARDLEFFTSAGYRPTVIQPIDMFPHTSHIETVAILERGPRPKRVR